MGSALEIITGYLGRASPPSGATNHGISLLNLTAMPERWARAAGDFAVTWHDRNMKDITNVTVLVLVLLVCLID